jgi:hypothetical protein
MKRIAIAGVISVVILAATAYISARIGYDEGLVDAAGLMTSPEASYTVIILEQIQAGNTGSAVTLLETDLDSRLVDRWAYDRRGRRFLSILRRPEITAIPALIGVGARHRANYPSTNTNEKTRRAIAEVVEKYAPLAPS